MLNVLASMLSVLYGIFFRQIILPHQEYLILRLYVHLREYPSTLNNFGFGFIMLSDISSSESKPISILHDESQEVEEHGCMKN